MHIEHSSPVLEQRKIPVQKLISGRPDRTQVPKHEAAKIFFARIFSHRSAEEGRFPLHSPVLAPATFSAVKSKVPCPPSRSISCHYAMRLE